MFEVWHFYHVATERGYPALWRTVMHPECDDYYAVHEVNDHADGEYPYVEFVRERHVRSIMASRGLPEVLDTQQSEIKVQRDSRIDRTSLTTLPPIKVKLRRGGAKNTYGPGVEIPVERHEDVMPMTFGAPDSTSIEVERATKRDINEYCGRNGVQGIDAVDPQMVQNKDQALVTRALGRWNIAGFKMLKLAQQYTPPMTIGRVVGMIPKPEEITRESIRGGFSVMLNFDARYANQDFVFGLMERMEKYVLPMDTNAVVNRDAMIRYVMAAIDPTLADLVVRESGDAQQSEIEDEMDNLVRMVGGVDPIMKLKGQNHALRLQTLQQQVTMNQDFYNALLQTRPDFAERFGRRVKFLQQQVAQQQNKMIGRYGVRPSAGSAGAGAGGAPAMLGNLAGGGM
jgi:hypothetical protein